MQRKAGKVKFSDPDFVAAVDKFVKLRDAGYINKDALSINYAKSTAEWDAGSAAMWPMGGWAAAAKVNGFEEGVFAFPSSNGSKVLPVSIGAAVYISAKTAHPAEAKKAAVSLITDPAWQAADMKNDAVLPIVSGITPLAGHHEGDARQPGAGERPVLHPRGRFPQRGGRRLASARIQ